MPLTKEILETYQKGLENERQQVFNTFQAINGGLQVVEKLLKFLELEEGGQPTPSDLGLSNE